MNEAKMEWIQRAAHTADSRCEAAHGLYERLNFSAALLQEIPLAATAGPLLAWRAGSSEPSTFQISREVLVGRTTMGGLQFSDSKMSRQHFRIYCNGGEHVIEDLCSRNGTRVNGARVARRCLTSGDVIEAGGQVIVFAWRPLTPNRHATPKMPPSTASLIAATGLALLMAGCAGLEGVPYRAGTAAALIHDSQMLAQTGASPSRPLSVPVLAGDADAAHYLAFSPVQVEVEEKNGQKRVRVFGDVAIRKQIWRVAFFKDGREVFHYYTSNKGHYNREVIQFEPLAADPALPVPDKVVVTRVKDGLD